MKLNDAEKNAFEAVAYIIESVGAKVTSKSVKEQLYLHPDFPSLLSFSDVLQSWNIPNVATRVFREQLTEIPLPAVAYLEINGGYFAPIRQVTATEIEWLDTQKGWQKEALEVFYQKWNHIVLLLEPNQQSEEPQYTQKRKEAFLANARNPFVIAGSLMCLCLWVMMLVPTSVTFPWLFWGLLLTKLVGVGVCILMVMSTLGSDNTLLRSICGFDSRTDCNSILSSPVAKVWGWLGWADVGLVYFAGGLIYLLTSSPTLRGSDPKGGVDILLPLLGLGALALPYTFWSVWYQWRVAKTWCTLCLIVQALIWVEFLIGLFSTASSILFPSISTIFLLGFSFLLPTVFWVFVKNPLQEAMQFWPLKRELQKSKFNPDYVQSLFARQPQMPPIFGDMRVVKMGNPKADNTLTIVTNPVCGPCVRMHPEIEEFLRTTDAVNCQFVFLSSPQSELLIQQTLGLPDDRMAEAMHRWYTGKYSDVDTWRKDLQIDDALLENNQTNIHRQWCDLAEIQATPTLYLNGQQMPLAYHLNDVENLCRLLASNGTLTQGFANQT